MEWKFEKNLKRNPGAGTPLSINVENLSSYVSPSISSRRSPSKLVDVNPGTSKKIVLDPPPSRKLKKRRSCLTLSVEEREFLKDRFKYYANENSEEKHMYKEEVRIWLDDVFPFREVDSL